MEQIRLFVTENSNWISVAWGCLVPVLLLAALHRIKRVEKKLRKNAEAAQKQTADMFFVLTEYVKHATELDQKEVVSISGRRDLEGQASVGREVVQESPETLINAVLGEVFP